LRDRQALPGSTRHWNGKGAIEARTLKGEGEPETISRFYMSLARRGENIERQNRDTSGPSMGKGGDKGVHPNKGVGRTCRRLERWKKKRSFIDGALTSISRISQGAFRTFENVSETWRKEAVPCRGGVASSMKEGKERGGTGNGLMHYILQEGTWSENNGSRLRKWERKGNGIACAIHQKKGEKCGPAPEIVKKCGGSCEDLQVKRRLQPAGIGR